MHAEDTKLFDGFEVPEDRASALAHLLGKGGGGWPGEAVAGLGIEVVEDYLEGEFDLGREVSAGPDFTECPVAAGSDLS